MPDESDKPQQYFDEMAKLQKVYGLDDIFDEFKPNTDLLWFRIYSWFTMCRHVSDQLFRHLLV